MELNEKRICCLIYDEGPGIPADQVENIFSSYFKVGNKTHGNKEGSGLGLVIAGEYVENYGGTINVVQSGKPGGRFQVMLYPDHPAD